MQEEDFPIDHVLNRPETAKTLANTLPLWRTQNMKKSTLAKAGRKGHTTELMLILSIDRSIDRALEATLLKDNTVWFPGAKGL
jgi:hypothetical protein